MYCYVNVNASNVAIGYQLSPDELTESESLIAMDSEADALAVLGMAKAGDDWVAVTNPKQSVVSRDRFLDLLGMQNQIDFNVALETTSGAEKASLQTAKDNLFVRSEIDLGSAGAQQLIGALAKYPVDNPVLTEAEATRILSDKTAEEAAAEG